MRKTKTKLKLERTGSEEENYPTYRFTPTYGVDVSASGAALSIECIRDPDDYRTMTFEIRADARTNTAARTLEFTCTGAELDLLVRGLTYLAERVRTSPVEAEVFDLLRRGPVAWGTHIPAVVQASK